MFILTVQGAPQNTTVQAAIITSIGLIVVALIGVLTALVTNRARKGAQTSSIDAAGFAAIARDISNEFTLILKEKDTIIGDLERRLEDVERGLEDCERREAELKQDETKEGLRPVGDQFGNRGRRSSGDDSVRQAHRKRTTELPAKGRPEGSGRNRES